jgi:DNA-binding protein HU-beta
MNRTELELEVAQELACHKNDAHRTVEVVLGAITQAISRGEEVAITGFGSFRVATRAASTGRNPRTGEQIQIDAKRQVRFKPGAELRSAAENGQG